MNLVKRARLDKKLRQIDLAKMADVSISWIWALENSYSHRISKDVKLRIAKALGCDYSKIFPNGSDEK